MLVDRVITDEGVGEWGGGVLFFTPPTIFILQTVSPNLFTEIKTFTIFMLV